MVKILLLGFEKIGFREQPEEPILLGEVHLIFRSLETSDKICDYTGVIIPQGIFESIDKKNAKVNYSRDLLLERERELKNLTSAGGWACFLVQEIIDEVISYGPMNSYTKKCDDTDLCKRHLTYLGIERKSYKPHPFVEEKFNQFREYKKLFCTAKTSFSNYGKFSTGEYSKLFVTNRDDVVGFEANKKLFFLPFHSIRTDKSTLTTLAKCIANAILDYKREFSVYRPEWLNEIQFNNEMQIIKELSAVSEAKIALEEKLNTWIVYKDILTTSGEILKSKVIGLLASFFSIEVSAFEEFREDFKLEDSEGNTICFFETKGTKQGIKRKGGFNLQVQP